MTRGLSIIVSLVVVSSMADATTSPAFTFDARYAASGQSVTDWQTYQVEQVSSRFSAATVARIVDVNANGIADAWESLYGLSGESAAADADPDGDGRTNLQEYNAGTDPTVAEDYLRSVGESDRYLVDTWIASSAAGYTGITEISLFSARFLVDTVGRSPDADGDGLPDWYERLYGLDPSTNDAYADNDGDGRTNIQEYNAGTNPMLVDDWTKSAATSDDPFVTDTRVYYTGGNPTMEEAFAVIKTSNGFICDTGGLYYDWDGDGIPNWWEARFSRAGSKTGLAAADDDDGDGLSNYGEFVAYTDPTNSASRFVIGLEPIVVAPVMQVSSARLMSAPMLATASTAQFVLKWQSVKGRTYSVYACSDLAKGWSAEPAAEIEGTGDEVQYTPSQSDAVQFFKVSVRLSDDY